MTHPVQLAPRLRRLVCASLRALLPLEHARLCLRELRRDPLLRLRAVTSRPKSRVSAGSAHGEKSSSSARQGEAQRGRVEQERGGRGTQVRPG